MARSYYEELTNPDDVRRVYATGESLDAKYAVMREYGIAGQSFEDWSLDRLQLERKEHLLDVGCGQGRFLIPAAKRVGDAGRAVGCDLSDGVLREVAEEAEREGLNVELVVADAASLPFDNSSFDVVMANHMLYHVANIQQALREFRRVLRPTGRLLATTNARAGMPELHNIHLATMEELGIDYAPLHGSPFTLENGRDQLACVFGRVEAHVYEGGFEVASAEPILRYWKATQLFQGPASDSRLSAEQKAALEPTFRALAEAAVLEAGGRLVVSKPMTAFVCSGSKREQ